MRKETELLLAKLLEMYPEAQCALEHQSPFELLVATILSAQCTDQRVNLVTPMLFTRYPTPKALAEADLTEVEGLIRSTGFFRMKARHLIQMSQQLLAQHQGRVPSDAESLARLSGVGVKTAEVVRANAFGLPALAVDTHIFRVARRLGLSQAKTPEKVGEELKSHFPEETWIALHHQLIHHGRQVCHARKPACTGCGLRVHCPTGQGQIPDPHNKNPQATPDPA